MDTTNKARLVQNQKINILIGIISMDGKKLKNLLLSMNNISNKNIHIECLVFLNHPQYEKPSNPLFNTVKIQYQTLEENYSLDIAEARNFLHSKILNMIKLNKKDNQIIWLLDEDILIDERANNYLSSLNEMYSKHHMDVLIGSTEGDSPNSAFAGMQVQLHDLIENIKWLDSLETHKVLPNYEYRNKKLREKYPDYYYDFSSRHIEHLSETFWIEPKKINETVKEAKDRLYSSIELIASGKNIFRQMKSEDLSDSIKFEPSLLRGANIFIFNIDTLRIKNPVIKINNIEIRRSDMLWALINKICHKKILKADMPVIHDREEYCDKELSVAKTIKEINGSLIFNALKTFNEDSSIPFKKLLKQMINKKSIDIEKSFKKTLQYIEILESFHNKNISNLCSKLKVFYTIKNLNTIINNLINVERFASDIYSKFIDYIPLMKNKCILQGKYGDFIQYDIADDDIKILSNIDIQEMDTKIPPIVRIHSSCANSEVFGATDCDCANQLDKALEDINKSKQGILFYINQEGRGHGYSKKIAIVNKMQTYNVNTYEACSSLGIENDVRDYRNIANILQKLNFHTINLMTNNPQKIGQMKKHNIKIIRKKITTLVSHDNMGYLSSKEGTGQHKDLIISEDLLNKLYKQESNVIKFYEKNDNYGEFSNFYIHSFEYEDKEYKTSEHYYQAQKYIKHPDIMKEILESNTPTLAKEISIKNKNKIDLEWNNKKIPFMFNALFLKFNFDEKLKNILLETKKAYIIEDSKDDSFWGCGKDGNGKNMLGKLLMYLRDEFGGQ